MAGLEEMVPASPPASRGGHGGDGAHGDKDTRCGGQAVAGLVEWEGRERGQRGRREQVQREAGVEAAAEALEARGDGVAGVEERDAGVEVRRDGGRVPLAGERGRRLREREREEVGEPRERRERGGGRRTRQQAPEARGQRRVEAGRLGSQLLLLLPLAAGLGRRGVRVVVVGREERAALLGEEHLGC